MENNNNNNNKKILILSIIGILVLIIAVVGISFAMYKFTGTGTKTNVIQTGTVNMSFEDASSTIALTNEYPMTDAYAVENKETHKSEFTITANSSASSIAIAYSIGIDGESIQEGKTLTKNYIKIALLDSNNNILVGTPKEPEGQELTGGTLISALENQNDDLMEHYMLAHKLITSSETSDSYTLYAWVADTYDLPTGEKNEASTGDDNIVQTEEADKTKQEKTTKTETFKFKLTVKAKQLLDENEYSKYQ